MDREDSVFSHHESCPKCLSKDNLSRYTSGWGVCVCGHKDAPDGDFKPNTTRSTPVNPDLYTGEVKALQSRGITEETCRKFGYLTGRNKEGNAVQIAPYYKDGVVAGQKIRGKDKNFRTAGDMKNPGLFGQQLWGDKGKILVITEGEIDCMTVSQLQSNKWPVVSLPLGAPAAKKTIQQHIEWLEGFESVILMFDMDKAGQDAVEECAPMFSPGRCKIATLPFKDANECLLQGQGAAIISAIWQAKTYRPDGLVTIEEILEDVEKPLEQGLPWCFDALTEATYGRRFGELYGVGAGTGVGKTDFLTQQIAYDVTELGLNVGCIFLEQKPTETAKRIAGKIGGKRFHVPDGSWTMDELKSNVRQLLGKVTFYDNFGQTDWGQVKHKIRFMAMQDIRVFYLDHLTAMADTSDEKGSIEQIMKELAGLSNELNIMITFVSHLTTPEGKSHEEGGRVSIRHFKGSRAIGFWSFFMFGLERNQQAEDKAERETTTFRVLKDRYTGQSTGLTIPLGYERATGRLFQQPTNDTLSAGTSSFNDGSDF